MKLIDFEDRQVMQLRCFHAHASHKYKNINAEPITIQNRDLLLCKEDGQPKPGQERFLVVTTPGSFEGHVRKILTGRYINNFRAGFIHVDDFHETKSSGATTPTPVAILYGVNIEVYIQLAAFGVDHITFNKQVPLVSQRVHGLIN